MATSSCKSAGAAGGVRIFWPARSRGWAHEFGRRVVALSVFVPIIGRAAPRRLAPRMLPPCATGVGIPGEPDSFGRLIDAQADGDLDTLRAHELPVARAVLPSDDPAGAIEDLAARLR